MVVGICKPQKNEGAWGSRARCVEVVKSGRKHDLYECPDNDLIQNDCFKKASRKHQAHRRKIDDQSCFWMRGILPKNMPESTAEPDA